MGGEFGGELIHICVWLSPFTVHLKPSQHCYSAIHQHKIKSFKQNIKCIYILTVRNLLLEPPYTFYVLYREYVVIYTILYHFGLFIVDLG